jgi:hypothetical protein
MVTESQLDEFVKPFEMGQTSPSFWTEALGMVSRAVNI